MQCPTCVEQGLTSKFYWPTSAIMTQTPPGAVLRFYDEQGQYHFHYRNRSSGAWYCSNGHVGIMISSNRCPGCKYGDPMVITTQNPDAAIRARVPQEYPA